ncbi:MAG: ATP-binding cassette domain-containing protein [Tissierellia bacterium]|nr:ATP-binding cassette domain-containing protein [Tissierellia bacterium]
MALEIENLGFHYKKSDWLFRNLNFTLERGEIVGISGYSGCGKSTFAKILANFLNPVEGRVLIDNEKFQKNVYQPVQLIFQHPEKTLNPKWHMKKSLNEAYTPDDDLLERFGIQKKWYDRYPIEISGGEMQRFCIVRSLAPQTKYLIADEITTMLDAITQAKIWKELLTICRNRNLGLMIISHETELLSKLCDRIVSLEQMQLGLNNK